MRLRSWLLAGAAFALPARAPGQQQSVTEVGIGAAIALAEHTFVGAELGFGKRPGPQSRVAGALAGGWQDEHLAARAQFSLQLVVSPSARRSAGVYTGVGMAFAVREESRGAAYLAVLLGVESAPGTRGGWYVEAGLGGGARVAAGWRWRWF